MRNVAIRAFALAVLLTIANSLFAADVIHDTGEAVPSAQYLAQLFAIDSDNPTQHPPGLQFVNFPIRSDGMTPGILLARSSIKRPAWLAQPVFLIGTDPQSRTWLTQNLARLKTMDALGIVVDVDNYKAFRELQMQAPGVSLAPASANGFAQSLGVSTYPVLIQTDGGIEQ